MPLLWQCSILAVNKFKNISSAKLLDRVKEIIWNNYGRPSWLKLGHGGTLDETATGVLVVGTGLACKMLPHFLSGKKQYLVTGCLGIETDTYNETGVVTKEMPFVHVTQPMMKAHIKKFEGDLLQTPPKYSALKLGGRRIADLTRDGIDVSMAARPVKCYSIRLLEFRPPTFQLEVTSGGGFYVRSLVHNLGHAMGTCAHVIELCRTRHGFLTEKEALSPDKLTYDCLVENALQIEEKPEFKKMLRNQSISSKRSWKKNVKNELWIDPT